MKIKLLCTGIIIPLLIVIAGCTQTDDRTTEQREAARWAEKTLAGLSVEKKVAQLICTDISGIYIPEDDARYKKWVELAGEYGIGGFVLYRGTPHNVARLLNRLQREADIPLLISADFEGGAGQQINGASEFPGNMAFAATGDEDLMYRAARVMAKEGRAMGIHLSYTPVSDVSLSPDNPQESVRSFGGDIELTGRMLKAYVRGYNEMGMITTAKHFPGRGDMKAMPGFPGFNFLGKPAEELENNEFRAFSHAVDAGVSFIMTEHLAVPSVTEGSLLPASVEPKLVKGIIREKLGFNGIITTDDLWYEHVIKRFGQEEVALKALEAGHDILLKPKDPVAVIRAVAEAIENGRISEEQINKSVYKLLYQKALLGLHRNRYVDETKIVGIVGIPDHTRLINEVADKSVTLLKNDNVLPLNTNSKKSIVHVVLQKENIQPGVDQLIAQLSSSFDGIRHYTLKPDTHAQLHESIVREVKQADLVILSIFVQRERHGDPAPIRNTDLETIKRKSF